MKMHERWTIWCGAVLVLGLMLAACGRQDEPPAAPAPPSAPPEAPSGPAVTGPSAPGVAETAPARTSTAAVATAPAETKDFDALYAELLALEDNAEFSKAMEVCRAMLNNFRGHERFNELTAALTRLKDERLASADLPYAIESLASDQATVYQVARGKLVEAGDTGSIFLRRAVREKEPKIADQAAKLLIERRDARAAPAFVERLQAKPEEPLRSTLIAALPGLLETPQPELLPGIFGLVKDGGTTPPKALLNSLGAVLEKDCAGDLTKFNEMLGDPSAYETMMAVVRPQIFYQDGSLINLATVRGVVVSVSTNLENSVAVAPLHPAYAWDARFGPDGASNFWWQIELPQAYRVDKYEFRFNASLSKIDYRVQTSMDGKAWTDRTAVVTAAPNSVQNSGGDLQGAGTDVRFVRLIVSGFAGFQSPILEAVRLTGSNSPPVNPSISLAQSTWAGGVATIIDPHHGGPSVQQVLNDDLTSGSLPGIDYYPNQPKYNAGKPATGTQFIISLKDKYLVQAVGLSTINDDRAAKNLDILVSTDPDGDTWQKVRSVAELPKVVDEKPCVYHEIVLDQPVVAQRVRFDVNSVWSSDPKTGGGTGIPQGYMSELYVYGSPWRVHLPEPEPVTNTVTTAGAAGK